MTNPWVSVLVDVVAMRSLDALQSEGYSPGSLHHALGQQNSF